MKWSKLRGYLDKYPWFSVRLYYELGLHFPELSNRDLAKQKIDYVSFGHEFDLDKPMIKERSADGLRLVEDSLMCGDPSLAHVHGATITLSDEDPTRTVRSVMRQTERMGYIRGKSVWICLMRKEVVLEDPSAIRPGKITFKVQTFHQGFRATIPTAPSVGLDIREREANRAYIEGRAMPPIMPSPINGSS